MSDAPIKANPLIITDLPLFAGWRSETGELVVYDMREPVSQVRQDQEAPIRFNIGPDSSSFARCKLAVELLQRVVGLGDIHNVTRHKLVWDFADNFLANRYDRFCIMGIELVSWASRNNPTYVENPGLFDWTKGLNVVSMMQYLERKHEESA